MKISNYVVLGFIIAVAIVGGSTVALVASVLKC